MLDTSHSFAGYSCGLYPLYVGPKVPQHVVGQIMQSEGVNTLL